jgi:rhodanese-related sulfurtransferase
LKFFVDNWYLFLAAAVSGTMLFWPMLNRSTGGLRITASQAVQLINREKAVLIDVREPAEYAAGHAAGSRSVPLGGLEASGDLPKNKSLPLVLVCASGARASRAAATLKKLGYENARVLAGGVTAWQEANLPVERSAG